MPGIAGLHFSDNSNWLRRTARIHLNHYKNVMVNIVREAMYVRN